MSLNGHIAPSGSLGLVRGRQSPGRELSYAEVVHHSHPHKGLDPRVAEWRARNAAENLSRMRNVRMLVARATARSMGLPYMWSQLWLRVVRGDGQTFDLGLAGFRVVTTAGVGFIVDAFQDSVELENMKFHGFGTGTTAEASGDTALVTELTTEYATDNTRPTGTTAEGASANIYQTVATLAPDSGGTIAVTEHGVFSQAATGGGVLLDRTVFSAVNLDSAAGDTLAATYELTIAAGS